MSLKLMKHEWIQSLGAGIGCCIIKNGELETLPLY